MLTSSVPPEGHGVGQLVDRFCTLLTLPSFTKDIWTEEHQKTVANFLEAKTAAKLFAFVDNRNGSPQLHLTDTLQDQSNPDLMYFLRDKASEHEQISDANFERMVQYGTITGGAMPNLLRLMDGVFTPIVSNNQRWPESARKDFNNQLHKFMALLTDAAFQMKGHTVLYVPREELTDAESCAKRKDVIQRLESLLMHWTRQIKEVVNNQHASETIENSGPTEEIQFWRSRCDDLSGISAQLDRADVRQILHILDLARSSYLEQFMRLVHLIQEGTTQAQDNLKFLSTLAEPCQVLATTEPKSIPGVLPKLLDCIRIIWANSKYYNTKERLTSLLRKVSNEIIHRCCAKISLDEIFHGDVRASMLSLQESISCGESWKLIYKKHCAHIAKFTKRRWDFDESSIFAQIDAFVQRCRDLLEVCEGQVQFARKLQGGEKAPLPFFGGSKGPEISKSLEDIEIAFGKLLSGLWDIRKYILDVKITRWHDDYNTFKQGVKDLEVMMQNTISSAFDGATTVEACVELLEIFHHLAKREAIKRTVEKKTADAYNLFLQELNAVKLEFEAHRKSPEILRSQPDESGSAYWARSLLRRISYSMNALKNAYYLPKTLLADDAKVQYELLVGALDDYLSRVHSEWIAELPAELSTRLDNALMARRGQGMLEVKFDRTLLRVFAEITYWQKLKMDVPFHIQEIYSKREELRVLRENILLVVRDHNSIMETLSPEEHLLFRERIRFLDRKINPGLVSLTWASKGITDYFVKECRRYSQDVQKTVSDYIESNARIRRNCKLIADSLLWNVESKRIYELEDFGKSQERYRSIIQEKLAALHENIRNTLHTTYEVFRNDGREVYSQWIQYVEKIDAAVEEALRTSVRRSLQEINKAINGEGKTRDGGAEVQPLFKVNVVLESQRVDFNPSLTDLERTINTVAREMISTIEVIPRLSQILGSDTVERKPRFYDIIANEEDILKIFVTIQNGMSSNAVKCQQYLRTWDTYREIWEINKDAFIRRYAKLKPALSTFDADINRYNEVANNTQKEETLTNINFIRLDCSLLKHALVSHCNSWQNKLTTLLNNNASTDLISLHKMFVEKAEKLRTVPRDLDQLGDSLGVLQKLQTSLQSIEGQFRPIREQYEILEKYEVQIKDDEKALLETLPVKWQAFQQTIADSGKTLQEYKSKFKADLLTAIDDFSRTTSSLREEFLGKGPFNAGFGVEKALKCIQEYRVALNNAVNSEDQLKKGLAVFQLEQPPSKDVEFMTNTLELLSQIWTLFEEWNNMYETWRLRPFLTLDAGEVDESVQGFLKRLNKTGREMREWDVFQSLRDRVQHTKRTIPLLQDLRNPALRDRHWSELIDEVGKSFDPKGKDFTLDKILDIGLDQHAESIAGISSAATKELSIEQGLQTIKASWDELELDIVAYKEERGYSKLRSTDSIFELLEDNQVTLSSMKASKFFLAFESQVDHWERTLSRIMEVIELLLQVQRQWMYLENIFVGAEDIRKQLPKESALFDGVNNGWKAIMNRMLELKNVLRATHQAELLEKLNDMNQKLEKIQKSLDMYLETKRQAFPRFYFISNDDLLEILGQAKDPQAVQSHLKKCFDGINKLELAIAGTDSRRHTEAVGMHSVDGEYVPFNSPVLLEGPVESWLTDVETAMRVTLRRLLMGTLMSMKKVKMDRWLKDWPGQLLITAGLMTWTMDCTKALQDIQNGEKHAMRDQKKKQVIRLKKLADLVRSPLNKTERKKLISLITIEVHSRDVIDRLIKTNVSDVNAFDWLCQLRFYWEKEAKDDEDCFIRQINTQFRYGYEYLGNSGRLVITPLTDRCYMTLTTALHLHRGGSPQGPAGTGKTETVKDLGKSLGKYVIVQNCSEDMDYKSIGRMFSGLAQTGAWGCFDEFNRINIEVLSVVALQISSILSAIARIAKVFVFEGQEIRLNTSCAIFITMNPGYAGRTELPDNLKALFRPVAMMVPDSALIAEIMLFAEGFSNTRILSKKVDTLYKLSIQQLSKQDHYDFGLRAMTSALRSAGARKRDDITVPDDIVVYLSMRDNNIPKLTAWDVPLFMGMLSDLFPGVEAPTVDYTSFRTALLEEMKERNLQPLEGIITKVIQLYETKLTRHGVMIVGATGSGKSTVWKLLQSTCGRLAKTNPDIYRAVKTYPLNPKALSLGELYGENNISTNEWTDGVLSNLMRAACADEKPDQKWLILDGPVDTLWIESMNTLLDDNKVLTLINGERIALVEQVSLLFEVDDMSTASPATVSRVGMIYMDYEDLGWRPYLTSWMQCRDDKGSAEMLGRLVDKYLPRTLEFRKSCKELVPVPEISAVISFCTLFDAVATRENGVDPADQDSYSRMIELWFLFSIIWTLGGSLTDESRKSFDMFLREIEGQFPSKDTVYEYYVDKQNKSWGPWEDKLPSGWRYSPGTPFYKIFVPTIDSIRNEFVIKSLISRKSPVLAVGDVGTGKTSLVHQIILNQDTSNVLMVNMSARTSSNGLQSILESKLEKRTKNMFVPIGGKHLIMFVDDLNMPAKDTFGSQPPLEFLRQWMDYGFCYDRQKQTQKYMNDVLAVAAMGPPGGGRSRLSPRVQSRFHVVNMTFPTETSVKRMFGTIINQKLQDFDEDVKQLGDLITQATVEIYHSIASHLLPTPAKIHYLFNLRDISRVFQGLLRANRDFYDSKESFQKLYVHEIYRVFHDRLVDKEDRDYFHKLVDDKLGTHFSTSLKQLCGPDKRIPIFVDFLREGSAELVYEEVPQVATLKKFMDDKLKDYNSEPGYVQADLVLFRDAMEHICRITRILRQPAGNVLLIGVGGSGRQSLTRLAAYIVETDVFQIKISKHYRHTDFREDLKTVFRKAGVDGKAVAFLITDQQIVSDTFLEDISNILSSGEVPNLFTAEELTEIKQTLQTVGKGEKLLETPDGAYTWFLERARTNLHMIICMSPVGEPFRNRLRMFPALVNCTTIDWFSEWPEDALLEVGVKYMETVDVGSDAMRRAVSQVFVSVHMSVVETSAKMRAELKRYNYVTPINYLELVSGYIQLLKEKRVEIGKAASKLRNGLSKLDDTRQNVEKISVELEEAKKQVAQFQKQCEDYLVVIVQQKREADEQAKSVATKAEKLEVEEEEVRAVADAAQADLDQALPALNAAMKALEGLNKKDLNEIRSYGKPPPLVEKVMEAVMVLRKSEPTWEEAKKQLGNPYFIKQLVGFDKDNISDKILKRVSQYCADETFQPDVVGRVSGAAKSLCMWVRAMETYGTIFRQVAPKREKLRAAQETLDKKQKSMREAKAKLQEIQDKLIELKNQYDDKVGLKEKLRQDSELTELKLLRAEQLVSGLAGERDRWERSIGNYENAMNYLPGDCLLAAAFLSYAGPFPSNYRQQLVGNLWLGQIKALEIPFSTNFTFDNFIGRPTDIREWNIQGLPSDAFSAENGIIVTRGRRWSIMVDPQNQANKWIKNMEGSGKDLKIIDLKQSDFMKTLENAIQYGKPVILQGVLDTIDPMLDPILNKSVVKKGAQLTIKLGDKEIEYNPNFRFYITTKLANPHYAPEIFAKATVVNFAVKEKGLEDQLLGIVVRREKPELEAQKSTLVVNVAAAKTKLADLEDEILQLLSTAQGSLLDDEKLVLTLQSSKTTAEQVTQQLIVSEDTEKRIDAARECYRPCAQRASVLYFVLNDLSTVDPMYQFSLDAYTELFDKSIAKSKRSDDLAERILNLNDYHTYAVYKNTCRGLFEAHKLLFAFQMTIKIMAAAGKLAKDEYDFLLRGGQVIDRERQLPNPYSEWITETAWDDITELDALATFAGLVSSLEQSEREWKSWFMTSDPEETAFPGDWDNKLNDLQRMLIVRSLRPDRLIFCASKFVVANLGQKFVEPPILDIMDIYSDSSPRTPLIFVLSPGMDPTSNLMSLAEKQGMTDRFNYLSLGQGQAPKATKLITDGIRDGNWVFLANCHLSISWMPSLDKLLESLASERIHPDFRIWLSSSPHPDFPISILQSGIKMTTEPPKGVKANLARLYAGFLEENYERCTKPEVYKKLLFSLCFFHSILLERKKFLTLGWNVTADFNDSDFDICENIMTVLLDEYAQTPWDALRYLIAEANYGGRITDDWDRRVLRSYVNTLFSEEAVTTPQFKVSSLPNYYIPDTFELPATRDYINSLPGADKPEVFGQHSNADIASQIKESANMLQSLLSLQPQVSSTGGASIEDKVLALAADILRKLPENIDYTTTYKLIQHDLSPTNVVLLQEIERYNQLLDRMRKSLTDVQDGIRGIVVMSPELEETFKFISEGKVPPQWSKAYGSQKLLAAWTRDLTQRVEFFAEWAKGNEPKMFWLGAFTFPTGFLTAVLQTAARRNSIAIDALSWEFSVLQLEDEAHVQQAPKEGVYINNLYLEGASWDRKNNCLSEPKPMELLTALPPIHFKPVDSKKKMTKGAYACPLYYYPVRSGTRERPSFIIAVELKTGQHDQDFFIKRGTAALASLT
ncbi:dynein heavy chain and region D6 of dynein motor-domain-containing protein [Fimicolochytrium jonesii]|uniref:dynein heavy chain and region D6 of dynein motor-domain-containing protein n=1 Tax=Fimicolochytrium jonesii TaxID=1396493 RepID=UPI0022FEBFB2|nr:dynein heavy chain and region D6 of dynein motor-domain-containing protein [Fimicolochytrium jonesii]KAI8821286.1 dynein heavy chain and region D6 of dynein motor-domain-containing protein [Fimicolochytrium jonesii]